MSSNDICERCGKECIDSPELDSESKKCDSCNKQCCYRCIALVWSQSNDCECRDCFDYTCRREIDSCNCIDSLNDISCYCTCNNSISKQHEHAYLAEIDIDFLMDEIQLAICESCKIDML